MARSPDMDPTKLISALALVAIGLLLTAEAQSVPGWRTDFSKHTVPLDEIVSGGPPKFVSIDQADR